MTTPPDPVASFALVDPTRDEQAALEAFRESETTGRPELWAEIALIDDGTEFDASLRESDAPAHGHLSETIWADGYAT